MDNCFAMELPILFMDLRISKGGPSWVCAGRLVVVVFSG